MAFGAFFLKVLRTEIKHFFQNKSYQPPNQEERWSWLSMNEHYFAKPIQLH
jgi:hypothetical protein